MIKLLLISIVAATVFVPARAASDPRPLRGLGRAIRGMLIFHALYLVGLLFIYPRLQ